MLHSWMLLVNNKKWSESIIRAMVSLYVVLETLVKDNVRGCH